MSCNSCGTVNSVRGNFCVVCGKPLSLSVLMSGKTPQTTAKEKATANVLRWGAFIGISCALIIYWSFTEQTPAATPSASVTDVTEPPSQNAPNFPPLRFSSPGHLPTKLLGFQLGMSVAEALRWDAGLENVYPSKSQPAVADPAAVLSKKSTEGFWDELIFSNGRLVYILSEVSGISPEDAGAFDLNTLNQLGKPSVNVYQGPRKENWVWIDGDDRIRYQHSSDGPIGKTGQPSRMQLELAAYPEYVADITTGGHRTDSLSLRVTLHDWGDNSEPVVLKPLPDGIGELRLRAAPWAVRQAVPGIDIVTISEQGAIGKLATADHEIYVHFSGGQVESLCEKRFDVQPQQFQNLRSNLLQQFGTPELDWGTLLQWENGGVEVDYSSLEFGGKNNGPFLLQCFGDVLLQDIEEASKYPPHFKRAPVTKSFF
jgi:hypothetical protein